MSPLSSLRFHHFFVFAPPGAPQVDELVRAGFAEGSRNRHSGQGTANRRIFFENGMLEFIWVEDETETRAPITAPTRLYERSRWKETGFSPYGIALERAPIAARGSELPFEADAYRPAYLPEKAVIWNARNDARPWEPMVFCMPGREHLPVKIVREPTAHPNGARTIERIAVTMAAVTAAANATSMANTNAVTPAGTSDAAAALARIREIELRAGNAPHAEIRVSGGLGGRVLALGDKCPLTMRY